MMSATAKAPTPPLTMAMQILGLIALGVGVHRVVVDAGCTELGCVGFVFGLFAVLWGIVALLSGLRGRTGLYLLIAAIVLPLAVVWMNILIGLLFLVVVGAATRASKDRLAPYYRSGGDAR